MPGRPRTKAKQVAALEDMTIDLFLGLFKAMPSQWRKALVDMPKDIRDPIGRLWLTAFVFARDTVGVFENLGNAMRQKAGIDGPGPWKECLNDWLADDESNAAESCGTEGGDDGDGEKGES